MIKTRLKKACPQSKSGKELEYFFSLRTSDDTGYIYHDWMTVQELANIEGCVLTPDGVRNRLKNSTRGTKFDTIEKCVFTPKLINGNSGKTNKDKKVIAKAKELKKAWGEQLKLIHIWKAGSMCNQYRIMQSKEFT